MAHFDKFFRPAKAELTLSDFGYLADNLIRKNGFCQKHGEYWRLVAKDDDPAECFECYREKADYLDFISSRQKRLLRDANIPLRFRDKSFSDFLVTDEKQAQILKTCQSFTADFANCKAKSFIFSGGVGTGKTHLATAMINELVRAGVSAHYTSFSELMRNIKNSWNKQSNITEYELIKAYTAYDFLVIDELGVQFESQAEKVFLFDIVNSRYLNVKSTILISNLTLHLLRELIGDRVVDRLREDGGKALIFDWQSQRGLHV